MEYQTIITDSFLKIYKKFIVSGKIPKGISNNEIEILQLLKKGDATLNPVFENTQDKDLERHFKIKVKADVLPKLKELIQNSSSFDGFYSKPQDQTP